MSAASREQLHELQRLLIDALLAYFRTPQKRIDPEMVNCARKLLADNGIDARELRDMQGNLAELAALTLPFQ